MAEERLMILEMVQARSITIEEADRLLATLSKETHHQENSAFVDYASINERKRLIDPRHLIIWVTDDGKTKANVRIPFSLVRAGLKFGKSLGAIGLKNDHSKEEDKAVFELLQSIDMDELLRCLDGGEISLPYTIMDIDHDENGKNEHILIALE